MSRRVVVTGMGAISPIGNVYKYGLIVDPT